MTKKDIVLRITDLTLKLSDNQKTIAVLLLAFCLYFPFLFLGYGPWCDSYFTIEAVKTMIRDGVYAPSRLPSYFVYEIGTLVLYLLGKSFLTNLGTLLMSLLTIFSFIKLCKFYDVPHKILLALFLILNPVYWVNSTVTLDYLWAPGFFLFGFLLFLKQRNFSAGLLFGMAIGARITSVIPVFIILGVYFFITNVNKPKILLTMLLSSVLGCIFYVPAFIYTNYTFGFFTYWIGDWNWFGHLARAIYKTVYFFGLQTSISLAFLTPVIIPAFVKNYQAKYKNIVVIAMLILGAYALLFFKVPIRKEYLLPAFPFFVMMLGIALRQSKFLLITLVIIQFSYNFTSFEVLRFKHVNDEAVAAKPHLFIAPGYLIHETIWRIQNMEAGKFVTYNPYDFE